ncbi:hypothetical protein [Coleofasciculus sp. F4-SAH-05]|uniref:hypothetical protein n=1 Tax=Coleofasciculus sp. F4-SAH-05 TaxID=3069525 RepID=UPI003302CA0D
MVFDVKFSGIDFEQSLSYVCFEFDVAIYFYLIQGFYYEFNSTKNLDSRIYWVRSLSDLETLYLLALISMRKAPKIFEIGSAHGETSYAMARINQDTHVFSLDLPVDDTVAHQNKMR